MNHFKPWLPCLALGALLAAVTACAGGDATPPARTDPPGPAGSEEHTAVPAPAQSTAEPAATAPGTGMPGSTAGSQPTAEAGSSPQAGPLPAAGGGVTGQLVEHRPFPSRLVAPRNVDVWLPPGYEQNEAERYAVLYVQDGQNIFDPTTSAVTHVDWAVDETMARLIEAGDIRPAIVVGIWSTERRVQEYTPQEPLNDDPQLRAEFVRQLGEPLGDRYLQFLVQELKPFIDQTYRTRPERDSTFLMGSSMGALISLYGVSRYPDVFGGAACVSTHWPVGQGRLVDYFATVLPDPRTHRLYFDFGTEGIDAEYEPYQARMDQALRDAGYVEGENWITRKFPGANHSETSWGERVDIPLRFLLGSPG